MNVDVTAVKSCMVDYGNIEDALHCINDSYDSMATSNYTGVQTLLWLCMEKLTGVNKDMGRILAGKDTIRFNLRCENGGCMGKVTA